MNHLDHCEQLADRFYRQLLEGSWQRLDSRLDRLAQDIVDEQRRKRHYLTMQEVHFKADQVAAKVATGNQQNFLRFRGTLPLQKPGTDSKQGRNDGQRDSLTLSRAIQATNQNQQQAQWQLTQRISLLRGGRRCEEQDNPLAPLAICHTVQDAICEVDIDPRVRLILYEVFAELLEEGAAGFYASVNQYLVDAGVLPNLLNAPSQAAAPKPQPASLPAMASASAEWEQELDQALVLLDNEVEWPAPVQNALALPGIMPTPTYISACTLLQRQIAAHVDFQQDKLIDPASTKRQYFKYLVAHMSRQRAGLNRDMLLAVELLTRMFQALCDDDKLPVTLRCLVSFLYAPCIRVALTDRSFFLQPDHPARALLDTLLRESSIWLTSHADDPTVINTVRGLVSTLACDLSEEGLNFSQALSELTNYIDMLNRRAGQTEQREVQAQAGMESLDRARARAQQEVQQALDQLYVHPALRDYVSGPCTDFLTYILLQHGEDRHWTQALRLLKGIALSIRGQLPREQLIQFQRGQQRLYKAVSKGLEETGYEGMLARDLLDCLRQAQQHLVELLALPERGHPEAATQPGGSRHNASLDQLEVGQWYRFQDRPQSGPIQLKLAWHSEGCARALFVDAGGTRRRLEYADALAKALANGQLQPALLPAPQYSEQVLRSTLHQLRLNSLRQRFSHRPQNPHHKIG